MRQKVIRYAVMIVALGVFMYSAYRLTLIYIESKESMEVFDEVKNMFISDEPVNEEITDEQGVVISNNSGGSQFVWDYEKMLSYNSDAVGYIRQDNGDYIDNPILQHSDNDYYLNHLPNNQVSSVGSIFVDYRITEGLEARNCIIYGHNMGKRVNNIMFGSLNWYYYCDDDPDYYKNHPTLDVYVGYRHYKYYIFAAYKTEAEGGWTYTYSFESDETFQKYVNDCKERSIHNFPEAGEITAEDKIITLSTCCETDEKRMIVQAVRREEINDVPNIPEGAVVAASRDVVNIGNTDDEETTPENITEPETPQPTESEEPTNFEPITDPTTQAPTNPTTQAAPETTTTTAPPTTKEPETTTPTPTPTQPQPPPETTTTTAPPTTKEPETTTPSAPETKKQGPVA
ncbi:MAG: class B sortase [Lachnospiraceae bacterium]|nr:class B sortase [Lachnospiraceae bacterium]